MDDILIGIIKFFGSTIESIIVSLKNKQALFVGCFVLIICLGIVYVLTKYF